MVVVHGDDYQDLRVSNWYDWTQLPEAFKISVPVKTEWVIVMTARPRSFLDLAIMGDSVEDLGLTKALSLPHVMRVLTNGSKDKVVSTILQLHKHHYHKTEDEL